MATVSPCVPCCSTPQTVAVPGPEGVAGLDGENGVNAFSILGGAGFAMAGGGGAHNIIVDSNEWMVYGQVIVIGDEGTTVWMHARVGALTGTTGVAITELNYLGDAAAPTAIPVGSKIAPAGVGTAAIQTGTGTLVAGTLVVAANITATSRIFVTISNPDAATVGFLTVPTASRVVGSPGSFTVNSVDATGGAVAGDTGSFNWMVIG